MCCPGTASRFPCSCSIRLAEEDLPRLLHMVPHVCALVYVANQCHHHCAKVAMSLVATCKVHRHAWSLHHGRGAKNSLQELYKISEAMGALAAWQVGESTHLPKLTSAAGTAAADGEGGSEEGLDEREEAAAGIAPQVMLFSLSWAAAHAAHNDARLAVILEGAARMRCKAAMRLLR